MSNLKYFSLSSKERAIFIRELSSIPYFSVPKLSHESFMPSKIKEGIYIHNRLYMLILDYPVEFMIPENLALIVLEDYKDTYRYYFVEKTYVSQYVILDYKTMPNYPGYKVYSSMKSFKKYLSKEGRDLINHWTITEHVIPKLKMIVKLANKRKKGTLKHNYIVNYSESTNE